MTAKAASSRLAAALSFPALKGGVCRAPDQVRTLDLNGQVWFVATDVAKVLDYDHTPHMVRMLDDDEADVHIVDRTSSGGNPNITIISESGLYHAVLKSRKPEAKKFRKWVTSEVLPAIRQTGAYAIPRSASPDAPTAKAITTATRLFQHTQRAHHARLSLRQSYLLAANAAQAATGVDLLAVWKLDPASLPDGRPQAVARSPKKDGKRLLEKLVRYIEMAKPMARHQDMLKRMHLHASDFRELVDDAVARGLLLRKSGTDYDYGGTVYVLAEEGHA